MVTADEDGDEPRIAAGQPVAADVHQKATDAARLHSTRTASGLTPLVWGGIIVLVVLAVLIWQLT